MGLLLWLSAIGHLLVLLTRAGALLVLAATTPISAAGLVAEAGRAWFWKSLRWFHAAALTPVLTTLVLGIGVQMTTGVANGLEDSTQAAIGTALPGVLLILIGCFSPLALFRLLAFVDPGTTSGAALRQGLAAQGGLQGLLAGSGSSSGGSATGGASGGSGSVSTSSAASRSDDNGRSQGESASEESTSSRFTDSVGGFLSSAGGAVGGAAVAGLAFMQDAATAAATVGSDLTSQMGVGHSTYHPDFSSMSRDGQRPGGAPRNPPADDGQTPAASTPPGQAAPPASAPGSPGQSSPASPPSGATPSGNSPAGGAGGQGGGGGAAAASGTEAAAAIPVVPV